MPSVGSTPTTTSPAPQHSAAQAQSQQTTVANNISSSGDNNSQHLSHLPSQRQPSHPIKLQQQQSPPQLHYHYQPQQHQTVTTTQPTPAGVFNTQIISTNGSDISPISSSNSFSSMDTNQTLLNSVAINQQHVNVNRYHHRSNNNKYSQFMIITPAVSIDRDFEYETGDNDFEDVYAAAAHNGNIFRMSLMRHGTSIDSGNSSDSSFRSNYNSYLHHSRQHLLPKNSQASHFYAFSSWRWCTLICAAMRCFGGGQNTNGAYSSSFVRPGYHHSRSAAAKNSNTPHRRLRSSSSFTAETTFEHFSASFKPRKTRDHMNNIMYEL